MLQSIKARILLVVTIPLTLALILLAILVKHQFNNLSDVTHYTPVVNISLAMGNYIHETQKERGLTSIYLTSKGKLSRNTLSQQRQLTDKQLTNLRSQLKDIENSKGLRLYKTIINDILFEIDKLNSMRQQISSLTIETPKALQYYTKQNQLLLRAIEAGVSEIHDKQIKDYFISKLSLMRTKEASGLERAIIAGAFTADEFKAENIRKFNNLMYSQNVNLQTFEIFATEKHLTLFNQKMNDPVVDEVRRMRNLALKSEKFYTIHEQLETLHKIVGYGGLTHNFKNYVLRKDDRYYRDFLKQYKTLTHSIEMIKKDKIVTKDILEQTYVLEKVFTQYRNALDVVKVGIQKGESIAKIDQNVKISDGPALAAIHYIDKKVSPSEFNIKPSYWFEKSTARINLLKEVENAIAGDINTQLDEIVGTIQATFITLITLSTLVIAALVFFIIRLIRSISGGLNEAVTFAERISQNDLSTTMKYTKKDEVGALATALNRMATNLNGILTDIQMAANQTASSGEELSASAQSIAQGAQSQTAATSDIQTSVDSMKDSIDLSTQYITEVNNLSSSSLTVAQNSRSTVQKSVDGIKNIDKSSKEINNIVTLMSNIASQTNLLALNAAIEAASAGEHGLGFAVVADEVRKLAERSAAASEDIRTLITESSNRVQMGVKLSSDVDTSLNEIIAGIESTDTGLSKIVESNGEQNSAASTVSQSVHKIASITEENAAAAQQMAASATELSNQSQRMLSLTERFVLKEQVR